MGPPPLLERRKPVDLKNPNGHSLQTNLWRRIHKTLGWDLNYSSLWTHTHGLFRNYCDFSKACNRIVTAAAAAMESHGSNGQFKAI